MADAGLDHLLGVDGPAAPPRQNGELLFHSPWESRVFGMAVALHEKGVFEWREFQQALIAEIRRWESAHPDRAEWSYYERWQVALESVLAGKGLCAPDELNRRAHDFAARPAGHDHR